MARRIKAKLPWHVVATGFTAEDFIAIGRGDVFMQESFTEYDIAWFGTFELAMEHPAARDGYGAIQRSQKLYEIDGQYDVQKLRVHAAKAKEASMVLHDNVIDPLKLPFLTADCDMRTDGCTLEQVALEVWAKHLEEVEPETQRTEARRQV